MMKLVAKVVIASMVAGSAFLAAASPAAARKSIKRGALVKILKQERFLGIACVGSGIQGVFNGTIELAPADQLNKLLGAKGIPVSLRNDGAVPTTLTIKLEQIRSMSAPVFRTDAAGKPEVCVTIDAEGRFQKR